MELVRQRVTIAGRALDLLRPPDSEALLDEQAFEREELLPYWAELWPSGVALAEAVAAARPRGRVLELGAGLGLPSLVAALGGAEVVATDWAPDAVALLERNAARNGAALTVREWRWTDDPAALGGPFDLVLGADVLYEARNVGQLLDALPALVSAAGEAWLADPGRPRLGEFLQRAAATWAVETDGASIRRLRRPAGPRVTG